MCWYVLSTDLLLLGSQPTAQHPSLCFGLRCKRHDAISAVRAPAELDEQCAQFVETKDRQVDQIARFFLGDASVEKVARRARVVECDDLVAGVQSLIVSG